MTRHDLPLSGRVALVAGATRGAGRAIAVELAAAGAHVVATGRSSRRTGPSDLGRDETIEDTAEIITERGDRATAVRVDHSDAGQVRDLVARIDADHGRLDVLVNDIWGADHLVDWGRPFHEQDLDTGLKILHRAVDTHLITSHAAAPLLIRTGGALLVEVTDGTDDRYRGSLFYDLAKASVLRLAAAQAADLGPLGVTALAISPGFLRSEAVLDHFGVTEDNWRDAIRTDPDFAASETPHYLGRVISALAADAGVSRFAGRAVASWELAPTYGITDVDGSQPDWGRHWREVVLPRMGSGGHS